MESFLYLIVGLVVGAVMGILGTILWVWYGCPCSFSGLGNDMRGIVRWIPFAVVLSIQVTLWVALPTRTDCWWAFPLKLAGYAAILGWILLSGKPWRRA